MSPLKRDSAEWWVVYTLAYGAATLTALAVGLCCVLYLGVATLTRSLDECG